MNDLLYNPYHHNRGQYEEVVLQTKGVKGVQGVLRLWLLRVLGSNLGVDGNRFFICSTKVVSPPPGLLHVSTEEEELSAGGGSFPQQTLWNWCTGCWCWKHRIFIKKEKKYSFIISVYIPHISCSMVSCPGPE